MDKSETITEWLFSKTHSSVQCISDRREVASALQDCLFMLKMLPKPHCGIIEHLEEDVQKRWSTQEGGKGTVPRKQRFRARGGGAQRMEVTLNL